MSIYQLAYFSFSSAEQSSSLFTEIEKRASTINPKHDITGCLGAKDNVFIQYIEGPKEEVLQLFKNIKKDSRHIKVILFHEAESSERFFPQWSMKCKELSDGDASFDLINHVFDLKRQKEFGVKQYSKEEIFNLFEEHFIQSVA